MRLTLRWRILLTLVPLIVLSGAIGGAGIVLLYRVSNRIDAILRENYRSVVYMEHLNEALERIDSSFHFALSGMDDQAREQYAENWKLFRDNIGFEQANVTLPGESELAQRLTRSADKYRQQGDVFYRLAPESTQRMRTYHDPAGLLDSFKEIKAVSGRIRSLNQNNIVQASNEARRTVVNAISRLSVGLAIASVLAGLLTWRMIRTILQPIQAVTSSALAISGGNLDQVIPVVSHDELGKLAEAFNRVARHLREYRESNSARLLRAQRTSQATIDSFPDPVMVIDSAGHVEMANPAARSLLGVMPTPAGQTSSDVWQPPEALRRPISEALQGQRDYLPQSFDKAVMVGANGNERAVLPRILAIRDPQDHTLGAALVLQDVTRFRLLDQVKTNLVATVSHELKTPLTSIRLAVHLLLEEAVGPLTPKQMELLLDARENSERLVAVVNNLLDLARLEQGWQQLDIHPESIRAVLQTAADAFHAQSQDKDVSIRVDVPDGLPALPVDADRIGHALRNLVENALVYTDAGGKIALQAAVEGNEMLLTVTDTGVGILPEHLPHLFEKFYRVPGRSRGGGTGLGLAIVHEIVTAHGGTVSCESQPGVGTAFHIRLPLHQGATPPEFLFTHSHS